MEEVGRDGWMIGWTGFKLIMNLSIMLQLEVTCVAGGHLCCKRSLKLQEVTCVAGGHLCCKRSLKLQEVSCVAGGHMCCRRSLVLQEVTCVLACIQQPYFPTNVCTFASSSKLFYWF